LDDWLNVSTIQFKQHGGHGLLNYYNNSIFAAVKANYPQHSWDQGNYSNMTNYSSCEAKLRRKPKGFWKEETNKRVFLDNLAKKLGK
jgi:hypothetical protein